MQYKCSLIQYTTKHGQYKCNDAFTLFRAIDNRTNRAAFHYLKYIIIIIIISAVVTPLQDEGLSMFFSGIFCPLYVLSRQASPSTCLFRLAISCTVCLTSFPSAWEVYTDSPREALTHIQTIVFIAMRYRSLSSHFQPHLIFFPCTL